MARAKSSKADHEVRPIVWDEGALHLLDQRRLPREERYVVCRGARDTARAIFEMVVRAHRRSVSRPRTA